MPRLSIVIPNRAFNSDVEDTLVSVLQNRPEYSEVVVATSDDYNDPYGLGREVRFVSAEQCKSSVELINFACGQARGDVLHLLMPGTLVTDGWTDNIWSHFKDDQVASVSPVLLPTEDSARAMGMGVNYLARGERRLAGNGSRIDDPRVSRLSILGPMLVAGFYRRGPFVALQGFDTSVGESLADVELGLAFQDLGLRSVVDIRSHVVSKRRFPTGPRTFAEARHAERLFLRHRQSAGQATWRHAWLMAVEAMCGFPHPRMLTRLFGRAAARRDDDPRAKYDDRLQQARAELSAPHEDEVSTIRLDFEPQEKVHYRRAA